SMHQDKIIKEEIEKMEKNNIIRKSESEYASPLVLVKKSDNTYRPCVNYKLLNEITKKDAYPLPRIDDILDSIGGSAYFSTLDFASGYWQIPMDEKSIELTAFTSKFGLYEFLVLPFGLSNAPATFQRTMDNLFRDFKWNFILVYIDDIIIYS